MTDIQNRYYQLIDKITTNFKEYSGISELDIMLVLRKTSMDCYRTWEGSHSLHEVDRMAAKLGLEKCQSEP